MVLALSLPQRSLMPILLAVSERIIIILLITLVVAVTFLRLLEIIMESGRF